MILLRLSLIFIFFFACNTEPIKEQIEVGNTVKVESSKININSNINYNYLWSKPSGPNGHDSKYTIDGDKMLFTPDTPGHYTITLLIESANHKFLHEETFYYIATGDKIIKNNVIKVPSNKNSIEKNFKEDDKKEMTKVSYTLQIASWPSAEEAKKDQMKLSKLGFDSYIEQFYIKNKDQTWWRVRVGHFTNKNKAELFKTELSKIINNDIWIDFIKE